MLATLFFCLLAGAADPVAQFNAGVAAEQRGDFAAAEGLFSQAQLGAPGWALPGIELADVLQREGGADDRALNLLKDVERIDPANPRLFQVRALALLDLSQPQPAEAAARQALALRADYPAAEAALADALWAQGKRDEAVTVWQKLTAQHPEDTARRALLVDRLVECNKAVEAEKELRLLAAEQPKNPVWHRRLARVLDTEGLVAEASAERNQAAKLAGQTPKNRHLRPLRSRK